jgi:hypothetical protein
MVPFRAFYVGFDRRAVNGGEGHTSFSKVPVTALTHVGRKLASNFEWDSQSLSGQRGCGESGE